MGLDKQPNGSLDRTDILSVKGGYSDETANISFGASRTPNVERPTLVAITASVEASGGSAAEVAIDIDGIQVESLVSNTSSGGLSGNPNVINTVSETVIVPAGSSYTIRNVTDPNATNAISSVQELTL